ncbi:jg3527 [Pararge aegeria aegeria]|uniref:Jg3527 protein n=1 Tax=Pararge aegeria aegeria TaxID=348720 RepID=A0A8S4R040_9NEOP|nr:jg3527 [Pararge aegeria aegeria]
MDIADTTSCAECLKCIHGEISTRCTSSECNRYFCSDCANPNEFSPHCEQDLTCTECCQPQDTGEHSDVSVLSSDETQEVTYEKPEIAHLISDIRRLSRGLMSIKNKLREATLSITHGHERQDNLYGSKAEAKARIKTLEKRIREIELLRYTVKELRKELNTQSYIYVLNSIEVSLDTTMKIFCALHIMQQKK